MRNSAQYALDCMRKPLEIKNFPGGGPFDPLTVEYIFLQILTLSKGEGSQKASKKQKYRYVMYT